MKSSPGAIKYVKPEWDYVDIGLYLYPSIFYALGLAKNQKVHEEENFPGKVIDDEGIEVPNQDGKKDDIRDKISGGPSPISFIQF